MSAEAGCAVGEDLGEELLEEVVTLEDGATAVCGDVNNELLLASGDGLVDEVGVDVLETLGSGERVDSLKMSQSEIRHGNAGFVLSTHQHSDIIVTFVIEKVAGVLIGGLANKRRGISRSWDRCRRAAGCGRCCRGGVGRCRCCGRACSRQSDLIGVLRLAGWYSEEVLVELFAGSGAIEVLENASKVGVGHSRTIGKLQSRGRARVDLVTASTTREGTGTCAA